MTPPGRRAVALAVLRFVVAFAGYGVAAVLYRSALGRTARPGLLAVLVATVAVALLLHAVQTPLARVADRIAYRSRAESQRLVRGLLRRMAGTLPVDDVVRQLAETAGRAVGGPRASVTLTLADGQEWSQVWPPDGDAGDSVVSAGVHHRGVAIGAIEVDLPGTDVGPTERRLLGELAAPAGLALSTVRLTVDLRRRIDELEHLNAALRASGDRLRTTRQDEQRRLRREIDAHVLVHLTAAADLLAAPTTDARSAAAVHCEQALAELRLIARGIYPSRLDQAGLLVSLDGWLERARTHADIRADTELIALHRDADLEACLYFCAVTALDALATAGASALVATAAESQAAVTLTVGGSGGGAVHDDEFTALRDRIEAFDGTLGVSDTGWLLFSAPLRESVGTVAPAAAVAP